MVCKLQSDIETKSKQLKLTNPISKNYETITVNLKTYNTILKKNIWAAKQIYLEYLNHNPSLSLRFSLLLTSYAQDFDDSITFEYDLEDDL